MNITADELFKIIGKQLVTITMLQAELADTSEAEPGYVGERKPVSDEDKAALLKEMV